MTRASQETTFLLTGGELSAIMKYQLKLRGITLSGPTLLCHLTNVLDLEEYRVNIFFI